MMNNLNDSITLVTTVLQNTTWLTFEKNDTDYFEVYDNVNARRISRVLFYMIIALSIIGVLLNISSIIIFKTLPRELTANYKLLLNLSVCDLILASCHGVMPFILFECMWTNSFKMYGHVSVYSVGRAVLSVIYQSTQYCTITTLLALAVDLLIAVKRPLRYRQIMTKKAGTIIIACSWTLAAALVSTLQIISALCPRLHSTMFGVALIAILLSSLGCCIAFVAIYINIFCEICRFHSRAPSQRSRQLWKTSITMAILIVTYLCGFLPMLAMVFSNVTFDPWDVFGFLLLSLYVSNSVTDPIVYVARVQDLRAQYGAVFRKCVGAFRRSTDD